MEETLEDLKREYMKEIYIANIKIQALTKENEELREENKDLNQSESELIEENTQLKERVKELEGKREYQLGDYTGEELVLHLRKNYSYIITNH